MQTSIKETLDSLETLIRERGFQKVQSRIDMHEFDGKKYLLIDDVIQLCHEEQVKCEQGAENCYRNLSINEKQAIVWAIYHLRSLFISEDLSKATSIDEYKEILGNYFKKGE